MRVRQVLYAGSLHRRPDISFFQQFGSGGSFGDVLSTSYGLTGLPEYGGEDSHPLSEANMAAIGEAASQCLSNSFNPSGSPSVPHSQPSPAGSGSHYEAQNSPFGEMGGVHGGGQEFHAEFISQPIGYPGGVSPPGAPGTPCSEPGQSPSPHSQAPHSPSNTLPSFVDTYTPSVATTIEPRPFGAEAEYENRLRHLQKQQQHQQQQQQQQHQQQMTVRFQLKTEAPDSSGYSHPRNHHPAFPGLMQGGGPPAYDYRHHPDNSEPFYLKKEPHSYSSSTPSSSPTPTHHPSAHQFSDFFHPPSAGSNSLITLTNYSPFPTDFHTPEAAQAALSHCPKFETDMESLQRVRRTILSTPQPM